MKVVEAIGIVAALVAALVAVAAGLTVEPTRGPFVTLVRQTDPPVILFEHVATKRCFLATTEGGLINVERTLCESLPHFPPPIGPPISPER